MPGAQGAPLLSSDSASVSGLLGLAGARGDTTPREAAELTGTEPGTGYNVKMAREVEEVKHWWRQKLLERSDDDSD